MIREGVSSCSQVILRFGFGSIERLGAAGRRGSQELPDGLDDLVGALCRSIVTGALDDLQLRVGNSGCQLRLMLGRKLKVVTACHDQGPTSARYRRQFETEARRPAMALH